MSFPYDPSDDAEPDDLWVTTFLSERDVSAQVPINFVPRPGISLTAACFSDGVYDDTPTQLCFSNLLASQIRRYVIDIYWDSLNRRFNLCPVQIPINPSNATRPSPRAVSPAGLPLLVDRQNSSVNATASNSTSGNTTTTPTSTTVPVTMTTAPSGNELYQLGPYQCSDTLTFSSVAYLLRDFLSQTSNTLEAQIHIVILNLRAAARYDAPIEPSPSLLPAELPAVSELAGTYFDSFSSYLYTPDDLHTDRSDLNASWYRRVDRTVFPLTNYFTMYNLADGDDATEDGWPDEIYIQVNRGKRFLAGIQDIDPQMSEYNLDNDTGRLFPPDMLTSYRDVAFGSNGEITDGCFYDEGEYEISRVNNSWAVAALSAIDPSSVGAASDNLTACGISPVLNFTVGDVTADVGSGRYQGYGNEAIWSWAYEEPKNDSSAPGDPTKFRCALMVSDSSYSGHWKTAECTDRHRAACREAQAPYRWRLSTVSVPYDSGETACTGNTTFDTPRSGLENTYLHNRILTDASREQEESFLAGVWVNFNSLDVESCWVTSGLNGTCPYYESADKVQQRQIIIPAIAALVILILTVLTVLVKCNSNRRNSRSRRRGDGGWDYEGVPS